ncbi:hypothetical protein ACHAW6_008757 [Cyclotella cf. meneghiniana]
MQIKQLNGHGTGITSKILIEQLKKCTKSVIALDRKHLLNCLLQSTALELTSGRSNNAEERRVRWTTYFNIKSWFDNWERDFWSWDLLKLILRERQLYLRNNSKILSTLMRHVLFWIEANATEVSLLE